MTPSSALIRSKCRTNVLYAHTLPGISAVGPGSAAASCVISTGAANEASATPPSAAAAAAAAELSIGTAELWLASFAC